MASLDSFERKFVTKDEFKKYTGKVLEKLDHHEDIEKRVLTIEEHLHFPIAP